MRSKRVTTSCRIVLVEKYFHLKYSSASLKYTVVNATVIFPLIWINEQIKQKMIYDYNYVLGIKKTLI